MVLSYNNNFFIKKTNVVKNFTLNLKNDLLIIKTSNKINENINFKLNIKTSALEISEKNLIIRRKFFNLFWSKLMFFLKNLNFGFFSELVVYGIGYHFFILNDYIRLDFGYSHFGLIKLPAFVNVYTFKKQIILNSYDFEKLELFLFKLLKFKKKINPYQLKGLFLKSSKIKVKVGKQKHI